MEHDCINTVPAPVPTKQTNKQTLKLIKMSAINLYPFFLLNSENTLHWKYIIIITHSCESIREACKASVCLPLVVSKRTD